MLVPNLKYSGYPAQNLWSSVQNLQYADDTLIVVAAFPSATSALKNICNLFAHATDVTINFSKTTLATLHSQQHVTDAIATILGCTTSSFPQTYLGLPLSPTRPPSNTFLPVLECCKKLLSAWRAKLITKGDRLILITAVLIPKKVLKTIDALKQLTCSGA